MCLERTIMYLAQFVVSGYFMKYWTWRCKKFSCMTLKNIFLLPQFVPPCFLLQTPSAQGSLQAENMQTAWGPSLEHPGNIWKRNSRLWCGWKGGKHSQVGLNGFEDFSNLSQWLCSLLLFLNNVPFFLSTRFFNDYLDFKKSFYVSPPAQRHKVY